MDRFFTKINVEVKKLKRTYFIVTSIIFVCFLVLTACGGSNGADDLLDESIPIEVELEVPESADPNEEVTFTSIVTQGDDLVDDATEVIYEIWLEGQKEESEM